MTKPKNPFIHEHPTPEPPQSIEEAKELHKKLLEQESHIQKKESEEE